jgi:hypothetical protein
MTAKTLLSEYESLPARERRKVWTFFAQAVAREEDARDLAAARLALAESGTETDWPTLKSRLLWNRKASRQPATA